MVVNLEVRELEKNDEKAWDEYVLNSDTSTFFHQIGWKNVIEKTYGHEPHYLIAEEGGDIRGILPLFLMKSRIFGKKLISVPFGPYGGVCADDSRVEKMLVEESKKLTCEYNAKYLELRIKSNKNTTDESLISTKYYVTSILELNKDPNIILMEKFNRNKRKTIYKSQKKSLSYKWTTETNGFYELFIHNMRKLGSPAHSKKFFENLISEFPDSAKVLLVEKENEVIYVSFYLFFKDTMINSWSSTLKEYREYYPTDFGIWNAIKYGCHNGYNDYDFGRSQLDSTNMEFKKRWGAEIKKLEYQYYLNKSSENPNNSSENQNRQNFAKVWKRLPVSITRTFGPMLRKQIA